jgi:hypothetical protein
MTIFRGGIGCRNWNESPRQATTSATTSAPMRQLPRRSAVAALYMRSIMAAAS